jgi:hypothetical protein
MDVRDISEVMDLRDQRQVFTIIIFALTVRQDNPTVRSWASVFSVL